MFIIQESMERGNN